MTDLQPGPAMDEAVCKLVGIAPTAPTVAMVRGESRIICGQYPPVSTAPTLEFLKVLEWVRPYIFQIDQTESRWVLSLDAYSGFRHIYGDTLQEAVCRAALAIGRGKAHD